MTTIREAFASAAIRGTYEGNKASILPLTHAILNDLTAEELAKVPGADAGYMLLSWNEGVARRGLLLDPFAGKDLSLSVSLSNGDTYEIKASEPADAAREVIALIRQDTEDREAIAKAYEAAVSAYNIATERGQYPDAPVAGTPTFADGAFDRFAGFVEATKSGLSATVQSHYISAMEENHALSQMASILRSEGIALSAEETSLAAEYRGIRQEIGLIQRDHPLALGSAHAKYEADDAGEATQEVLKHLNVGHSVSRAVDASAMFPDRKLAEEVFKVLTTTPVNTLFAKPIDPREFRSILQDLRGKRTAEWNEGAVRRLNEVLEKRMPGYVGVVGTESRGARGEQLGGFQCFTFAKDGADIMLIADRGSIVMYAWDSASRVNELDVRATVLNDLDRSDVPTGAQMQQARAVLAELQHDNGADINFDWDQDDVVEDDDFDMGADMARGPRPIGA